MSKNILITGVKGQLGQEIHELVKNKEHALSDINFYFTDRDSLDITNEQDLREFIEINVIDTIVNCAADTAEYPTPAKRQYYSVLSKNKIKKSFNLPIPYWRNALKECIEKLETNK